MSIPVELHALEHAIGGLGPEALLVTVTEHSTPHVVSVLVTYSDGRLVMGGGQRTRANVAVHPRVTLVWPVLHDDAYRLIVDGDATTTPDEHVEVVPTDAVFHRVADALGDGPNCLALDG